MNQLFQQDRLKYVKSGEYGRLDKSFLPLLPRKCKTLTNLWRLDPPFTKTATNQTLAFKIDCGLQEVVNHIGC